MRRHLRYPPQQLIPTLGLGECRPARHEQTRTSCADRRVERCSVSHPPQPGLRGRPATASAFPALLALPLAVCRQYRRPSSSSCRAVLTRSSGVIASSRATRSSFSSAPILGLPKARSNSEFAATAITRRWRPADRKHRPPAPCTGGSGGSTLCLDAPVSGRGTRRYEVVKIAELRSRWL